jgi:hypothetical protein
MKSLPAALLGTALIVSGCAGRLTHAEIDNSAPAGTQVDGIPYRVAKRYKATIYEKSDKGYEEIHALNVTTPDLQRLYVLGFKSQPFSSSTI